MRAVVARHIVVVSQGETGPHRDGFLTDVGVRSPHNLTSFG